MKPNRKPHVEVAADSNIGKVRKINEDRYAVAVLPCGKVPSTLGLLADGVGGHAAGEVAAETVIQSVLKDLSSNPCTDPRHALPRAVIQASREVFEKAQDDEALHGMATTIAGAWVIGDRLYTVTVGDSRIYLSLGGSVFQASVDHTWVQEAIEVGLLTPAQAKAHPNAHVLRRHMGGARDPLPDMRLRIGGAEDSAPEESHQGTRLNPGDSIVLCSDGLSDLVSGADIQHALRHASLRDSVEEMIALACQRGGHDNITIVALRIPQAVAPSAKTAPVERPAPRRRWLFALGAAALAAAGILLAVLLLWQTGTL